MPALPVPEADEPEPNPEPEVSTEPESEPVVEPAPDPGLFAVSEEVFTETFEDIRTLIADLNDVIHDEDYDVWLTYLSREYIAHFSNSEVLRLASEQPLLRKYDIRLRGLRDYFTYVVVPSRSNARLDDLVFVDTDHVNAIMIINDQRTILYSLEKGNGAWKIGL